MIDIFILLNGFLRVQESVRNERVMGMSTGRLTMTMTTNPRTPRAMAVATTTTTTTTMATARAASARSPRSLFLVSPTSHSQSCPLSSPPIVAPDSFHPSLCSSRMPDFRVKADTEFGVSRGIDFKGVKNVVNVDFPPTPNQYIHRTGRYASFNTCKFFTGPPPPP